MVLPALEIAKSCQSEQVHAYICPTTLQWNASCSQHCFQDFNLSTSTISDGGQIVRIIGIATPFRPCALIQRLPIDHIIQRQETSLTQVFISSYRLKSESICAEVLLAKHYN